MSYRQNYFYKLVLPLGLIVFGVYFLVYLSLGHWERTVEQEVQRSAMELEQKGFGLTEAEIAEARARLLDEIAVLRGISEGERRSLENDPLTRERMQLDFQNFEFEQERQNVINRIATAASSSGVSLQPSVWESFPDSELGEELERPQLLWAQLALTNQVLLSVVESQVDEVESIQLIPPYGIVDSRSGDRIVEEVRMAIQLRGSIESLRFFFLHLVMDRVQLESAAIDVTYEGKGNLYIDRFILQKASPDKPDQVRADMVVGSFVKAD